MFRHPVIRPALLPTLVLLLAAASGCGGGPEDSAGQEVARNVRVMPLETSAVTEFFELAGPVLPAHGTDISSEEMGTVADIDADKGAHVEAGAPLVTLDRRLLKAELDAAEASLQTQEYNHDKTRQLFEAGKVSRLEMLQAETAYAEARSRRDVARTRHDRARVEAPFAGIVSDRYVEPGQLVSPGMPVARVIDPYVLELEGALTEAEVAWVREGMPATVRLEGTAEPVIGKVAWVGFEANVGNGKFPVEVHIANPDLKYRSGVIGRARVAKRTTDALVVIPRDAILPGERIDHVFVVEDERAVKRQVELGPSQGLLVAIRQGLEPGELLVVRGQRELRDGSLVAITERVAYGDGTGEGDPEVIRAGSAATRVAGEVAR